MFTRKDFSKLIYRITIYAINTFGHSLIVDLDPIYQTRLSRPETPTATKVMKVNFVLIQLLLWFVDVLIAILKTNPFCLAAQWF